MGIFEKFKLGFKKSADKLSDGFREIVIKKEIDDKKLNEIDRISGYKKKQFKDYDFS